MTPDKSPLTEERLREIETEHNHCLHGMQDDILPLIAEIRAQRDRIARLEKVAEAAKSLCDIVPGAYKELEQAVKEAGYLG